MGSNGTINASITSCPQVPVPPKSVHQGLPNLYSRYSNGDLVKFTYPENAIDYNLVCNLESKTVNMTLTGGSGTWQRTAANPTNTLWSTSSNNLNFYFYQAGQTATFRFNGINSCGNVTQYFSFKAKTCSGTCDQYAISPNPSSSTLNIIVPNIPAPCGSTTFATEQAEQIESIVSIRSFKVYDAHGQVKRSNEFKDGVKATDIDISDLHKGLYFLEISDGNHIEIHRFIKD